MRDLEAALCLADRKASQLSLPDELGVIRRSDDLDRYLSNLRRCGPVAASTLWPPNGASGINPLPGLHAIPCAGSGTVWSDSTVSVWAVCRWPGTHVPRVRFLNGRMVPCHPETSSAVVAGAGTCFRLQSPLKCAWVSSPL